MKQKLENLRNALNRLKEALDYPPGTPLREDATIQRFEFTFELAWRSLQTYLIGESTEKLGSPRNVLSTAYSYGIINDETIWLEMLRNRNLTTHLYDEAQATKIFKRIEKYLPILEKLYAELAVNNP